MTTSAIKIKLPKSIIDAYDNRCISGHVNLIVLIRLGMIEVLYGATKPLGVFFTCLMSKNTIPI